MAYREVESGGKWVPKEIGEQLKGTLAGRRLLDGKNGEKYTVFTVEKENGDMVNTSGAVIESKLSKLEDGNKVIITYRGKPKGTYADVSVMVWEDDKPEF